MCETAATTEKASGSSESSGDNNNNSSSLAFCACAGYLEKMKRKTALRSAVWQRRFFELPPPPSHYLRYFPSKEAFRARPDQPQAVIDLQQVLSVRRLPRAMDDFGIGLKLPPDSDGGVVTSEGGREYLVRTEAGEADAARWFVLLQARVNHLRALASNSSSGSSAPPAVLVAGGDGSDGEGNDGQDDADDPNNKLPKKRVHFKRPTAEEAKDDATVVDPYVDSATPEELQCVVQLRDILEKNPFPKLKTGVGSVLNTSDACLLRYVRARDRDLEEAEIMIRRSARFRVALGTHRILSSFVQHPVLRQYQPGGMPPWGRDRDGTPVFFDRLGRLDPAMLKHGVSGDDFVLNEVFRAERNCRQIAESSTATRPQHSVVMVHDMRGLGWKHMNSQLLAILKKSAYVMDHYYPQVGRSGGQAVGRSVGGAWM